MKKIVIAIPFIVVVAIFAFSTYSCKKDELIEAVITVKYLSDTTEVVPYAHVRIEKYDINVEGVCNEKGIFQHTFRDEAILDVRAWEVDSLGVETLYGETTIRLKKGEVARKSVFIN